MNESLKIAVCIATRQRPEGLMALLGSIDALLTSTPTGRSLDIRVVVIDNDPDESAAGILSRPRRFPLAVGTVSVGGYATVRNATVALAGEWPEWLAFVDDDETVEPAWLGSLVDAAIDYEAVVVAGQVRSADSSQPAPGIGFVEPPLGAVPGQLLERAHTDNLLINRRVLDEVGGFDPAYDVSGGEDVDVTYRIGCGAHRMVYEPGAIVLAPTEPGRLTMRYAFRRSYAGNHNYATVRRRHRGRPEPSRAAAGIFRVGQSGLVAIVALLRRDRRGLGRSICLLGGGLGSLCGTIGIFGIPWSTNLS